jgi:ankyrin repeat protein
VNGKEGTLGETPIMGAAQRGRLAAVKLLVENGASPCEIDRDGSTAEGQARRFRKDEVAQYLSQFHCKENLKPCPDSTYLTCVH